MSLGAWVDVGMAAVLNASTANVVSESYQWLAGADRGPGGRTSFVGRTLAAH